MSDNTQQNKNVLIITGASRGIGAEIARLAARKDWAVCINSSESKTESEQVATSIIDSGGRAITALADVSSPQQVDDMFEKVRTELGPVTGLVNNAGISGSSGRVEELDAKATQRLFEINILGPMLCTQAAVKQMSTLLDGNGGAIVNISSAAARHGGANHYVDYAASKAALDAMTYGHAVEQANAGIRINCVRPGVVWTEMNRRYMEKDPAYKDRIVGMTPLGRGGEESEIANGVTWLLSEEASFTTGAILDISGGMVW